MKQTALQWFIEQIENHNGVTRAGFQKCIDEALQMEKEQIIKAHDAGVNAGYELAKNDDIYIDSGRFKNTCNSQKYYFIKYEKGEQ